LTELVANYGVEHPDMPLSPLTVLNIIDQNGQPFEDDALLVTQMHAVEPAVFLGFKGEGPHSSFSSNSI
jgi:hypothetical protein